MCIRDRAGCADVWNDPYPSADRGKNIFYSAFTERPKHLDPVQSYSENEATFLFQIYEPPLQYDYLKRPYRLIPMSTEALPSVTYLDREGNPLPADANGVLYALAGFSGGITCYVRDGFLCYEFNLFEVQRTKLKSKAKLPTGKVKVEVESKLTAKIGGPMDVALKVNGEEVAQGRVPAAMSLHFTSNATFDIGTDLDSPVSLDYYEQAPFAFNGSIGQTKIVYLKK